MLHPKNKKEMRKKYSKRFSCFSIKTNIFLVLFSFFFGIFSPSIQFFTSGGEIWGRGVKAAEPKPETMDQRINKALDKVFDAESKASDKPDDANLEKNVLDARRELEALQNADADNDGITIDVNTGNTQVSLGSMGLTKFGGASTLEEFMKRIMKFFGYAVILASVIGFMIGGGMLIFSAGDQNTANRGKGILIASILGMVLTLLSYLIVTLVQSILYSV